MSSQFLNDNAASGDVGLPRVCVVSVNPFRRDHSNGMILSSLFEGYPCDRLSQVFLPTSRRVAPMGSPCDDVTAVFPIAGVKHWHAESDYSVSRELSPQAVSGFGANRWVRASRELWYLRKSMKRRLSKAIASKKPDLIYGLLGSFFLTKLLTEICGENNWPMSIHVTDDFVESLYHQSPFAERFQAASKRSFQRATNLAAHRSAIGPTMAVEYEKRYGYQWDWFTTLVDKRQYDASVRAADGVVRLMYAGNLHLGRAAVIGRICRMLDQLDCGRRIEFRLFAADEQIARYENDLGTAACLDRCGWITPEELPRLFHESDVLVHVESNDPEHAAYTRLSFSTKLSQYLMSGRPILAVGPRDLGAMEVLRDESIGVQVDSADDREIERSLLKLVESAEWRNRIGQSARDWAIRWVDREEAGQRFRRRLIAAAKTEGGSRGFRAA